MTPHSSPDWDQLGRYLAGESSPDEAGAVRRWLEEHPVDAQVVAALDDAAKRATPERPVDVEAALQRVKARVKVQSRAALRRFMSFAAAAAILMFAGYLVQRYGADTSLPYVAVSTGVGERDSVTLRDGSRILLGPSSSVSFGYRTVLLTGEAYFRVVHEESTPFIVRVGNATIRDIGTEFSVHSDPRGEGPVRVVVSEGAVELRVGVDSAVLRQGDVGVAQRSGRIEATRGGATADDLAWTKGRLVFRNATVNELTADLRRWYGVELHVSDSVLLRRHFTGSFAGEPADRVLDVIALALGARVDRRGDTAYLRISARSPGR